MTSTQWVGVAIIALVLAFGWFAFRQGTKVKPEEGKDPIWRSAAGWYMTGRRSGVAIGT